MTPRSTGRATSGASNESEQQMQASAWEREMAELSYAQARTALELVVAQLQSEDLEVEAMAELYRRALAYAQRCEDVLRQVEQEVRQLEPTDLEKEP